LKRATDNAKKEYPENICNEIMEFQKTGHYDLMYLNTKELGWKETQEIQNIGIKNSPGNRIVNQSQTVSHLTFSEPPVCFYWLYIVYFIDLPLMKLDLTFGMCFFLA